MTGGPGTGPRLALLYGRFSGLARPYLAYGAYRADGSWLRVHMTNLSYDGCKLLTEDVLDIGETLTLVMPRMQHMEAQVRWIKDQTAGIRFLQRTSAAEDRRARIGV